MKKPPQALDACHAAWWALAGGAATALFVLGATVAVAVLLRCFFALG